MTYRDLVLWIGISALTLAALLIGLAVRSALKRTQSRQPRPWFIWPLAALATLSLVALGAASLVYAPPGPSRLVNRPAPAPSNVIVVYLQQTNLAPPAVIAVSAHTGARRAAVFAPCTQAESVRAASQLH